jgi:large subunit ribosomal protein L6e
MTVDDSVRSFPYQAQKAVDSVLLKALGKDATLEKYIGARFSLRDGQKPHEMHF